MVDDPKFHRLEELTLPHFKDSDCAHDKGHASRVLQLAERICQAEGGDGVLVRAAALIHDIGCAQKLLGKERQSEERTLVIAKDLLEESGYDDQQVDRILGMIEVHGHSRGIVPDTLEGMILQDADRLDAMGAIGIARTFLVSGSTNRPIYDIDDPFSNERDLDDKAFGLDHFFSKLLKLKDGMHTATARDLARRGHVVLVRYLEDLKVEL